MGLWLQMEKMTKHKKGIRYYLMLQHVIVISVAVLLFEFVVFIGLYQYYYRNTEEILSSHAKNAVHFAMRSTELSPFNLQYIILEMINDYQLKGTEMQIVSPSGNILASSSGFSPKYTVDRRLLQESEVNQPVVWKGHNEGTKERVMAVVVPLENEEERLIYFRYITSLERIDKVFKKQMSLSLGIGLAIILVASLLSLAFAKQITTPLIQLTKASKRLSKGEYDAMISQGKYLGELDTLAKSFNEMTHGLLQHEKMKNQFISSVSHELRTPLTSIKGWSDTLLTGDLKNWKEVRQGLHIISEEASRLTEMVENLLDFSSINNQSFTLNPTTFHVPTFLSDVILQFEKLGKKKGIEITVQTSPDVSIYADRNRMKQVFINVIDNAIKYSQPGELIEINATVQCGRIIFSIKDEGQGMTEEVLEQVTTPFYKGNSNTSGTGLGLSICKDIVELHHGELHIESKLDKGTNVIISLPYDGTQDGLQSLS